MPSINLTTSWEQFLGTLRTEPGAADNWMLVANCASFFNLRLVGCHWPLGTLYLRLTLLFGSLAKWTFAITYHKISKATWISLFSGFCSTRCRFGCFWCYLGWPQWVLFNRPRRGSCKWIHLLPRSRSSNRVHLPLSLDKLYELYICIQSYHNIQRWINWLTLLCQLHSSLPGSIELEVQRSGVPIPLQGSIKIK